MFEIVKLTITLLPLLIEAIKAVESALPQKGAGPDKLDVVKSVMSSAYEVSQNKSVPFEPRNDSGGYCGQNRFSVQ